MEIILYFLVGLIVSGIAGLFIRKIFTDIFLIALVQFFIFFVWPGIVLAGILWLTTNLISFIVRLSKGTPLRF